MLSLTWVTRPSGLADHVRAGMLSIISSACMASAEADLTAAATTSPTQNARPKMQTMSCRFACRRRTEIREDQSKRATEQRYHASGRQVRSPHAGSNRDWSQQTQRRRRSQATAAPATATAKATGHRRPASPVIMTLPPSRGERCSIIRIPTFAACFSPCPRRPHLRGNPCIAPGEGQVGLAKKAGGRPCQTLRPTSPIADAHSPSE